MIKNLMFSLFIFLNLSTSVFAKSVIVMRHAERTTGGDDLTPKGYARAKILRDMFVSENVSHILSTNFTRTKKTVEVLAASQGRVIEFYDDIDELKQKILSLDGETIAVVGHSNTVPEIVLKLSGVVVPPIAENEYDRLYILSIFSQSEANSLLKLKYVVN